LRLVPKRTKQPSIWIDAPKVNGAALDGSLSRQRLSLGGLDDAVSAWYASQQPLGAMQSAHISRHWLIDKAISMPVEDAMRQGYMIDGKTPEKDTGINAQVMEYVTAARRTGGAVALFRTCPPGANPVEYYLAPLNLDAVTHYDGVSIIDATDCPGDPIGQDINDPASRNYMRPTYYRIGTRRYHKSHLTICTPYPVSPRLMPMYGYFGRSIPEMMAERVYCAERVANEAPLLTMTKRLRVLGVDMEALLAGGDDAMGILNDNLTGLQQLADNFGVYVYDTANDGGMTQLDTSLADLDKTIDSQYQICAAIARIPVTRLMGVSPGGLNSTGESDAEDYRQVLESIQSSMMQPLLERHYRLKTGADVDLVWQALDSPTSAEYAAIDAQNGNTVASLVTSMVLTPEQGAEILGRNRDSMFAGIKPSDDAYEI
jgi:hypothetical protein